MHNNPNNYQKFTEFVHSIYEDDFVPLHRPLFSEDEKRRITECIDSNFVSSAGKEIEVFEGAIADFTGAKYAIATVNGTAALHVALHLAGVSAGSEVITQAVSFVATANAVSYCRAAPVFVDIDHDSMSMSPEALIAFLQSNVEMRHRQAFNKVSGARISACVPMHTFGHPARIDEIADICNSHNIALVEDCAESLGSYVEGRHTGLAGKFATFSFNGNKIITTGGGGMIITDDEELAQRAKHITTTSKQPHAYEYFHDEVGFNYRMPNLNASMGLAQMEKLDDFLTKKRIVAEGYRDFFASSPAKFIWEREGTQANFWLNGVILEGLEARNAFLEYTNEAGVMTRPMWQLLNRLPMYEKCETDALTHSHYLAERLVNIPSSVPESKIR
ncbi:LegC family aminotransferase [Alphaproteobacteria bacterium]|nr:LegC family aminotransferase [Alphaproteobacteria bacterium]